MYQLLVQKLAILAASSIFVFLSSDKEAPKRTSDTRLMPATPTVDKHSKVHGSLSQSHTVKKSQDGVKIIHSQRSVAQEEIRNPDGTRLSMCHVSCEKRVSMTGTEVIYDHALLLA